MRNRIPTLILTLLLLAACTSKTSVENHSSAAEAFDGSPQDSSLHNPGGISHSDISSGEMNPRAIVSICKAKLRNGESFLTVEGFEDALIYYEAVQDTSALLDIYQLAAIRMRWKGRQDSAAVYLKKAIDISSDTSSPTRSNLFIELSNLYARPSLKKDYHMAISFAKEALKSARTTDEEARALHDIGLFYSFVGQIDSTAIYLERALAETDVDSPLFTTYALNYANTSSADLRRSVGYLNQIKTRSLGKLITLGFIYLNNSLIDSARYYMAVSKDLYTEEPSRYSINTYNNLRLLEQGVNLVDNGRLTPDDGTVTNDSISEATAIQRKISEERRHHNTMLQFQLLQAKAHRRYMLNIGLGIMVVLCAVFGFYVWYSKRKFLKLKQRLDNVKIEQIVAEASDDGSDKSLDLVRRRMNICIEQFRVSRLQSDLDKMSMQYRDTGNYVSLKSREAAQKCLIGCFADFIVDLKMTGAKLNMDDIITCLLSCLRESNAAIAACLGTTVTAVRTRKSRLRSKLPPEMLNLLDL